MNSLRTEPYLFVIAIYLTDATVLTPRSHLTNLDEYTSERVKMTPSSPENTVVIITVFPFIIAILIMGSFLLITYK